MISVVLVYEDQYQLDASNVLESEAYHRAEIVMVGDQVVKNRPGGPLMTTVSYEWHDILDGEARKLPVGARVFVVKYTQAFLGNYFRSVNEGAHIGEGRFAMKELEGELLDVPPCPPGGGWFWRRA